MLKQLRHEKILNLLKSKKSVEVTSLCGDFNVTEMTIRRDLDELASKGLVVRTHGGAVLPGFSQIHEAPFDVRIVSHMAEKEVIAREAFKYMNPGEKFFMNSSSTVFCLARMLDNEKSYLIASEATNIANELNTRKNISVIQIGGELRKNTISCVGFYAEEMIRGFSFDTAFIGINGLDDEGRFYCGSMQETGIYHAILDSSRRVIVLADFSKIGRTDFARIGNIENIDLLITDRGADPSILKKLKDKGLEILVV